MQNVDWGRRGYDDYRDASFDAAAIEDESKRLIDDEDVLRHSGIYPYSLTRDEKHPEYQEPFRSR